MRRGRRTIGFALLAALAASGWLTMAVASAAFVPGNILASVGSGLVKEFTPKGVLVATYNTGTNSITTGTIFDSSGDLLVTDFNGNDVSEFNPAGELTGSFGSGYNADPESIVLDGPGDAYVGQADGEHKVLKFDKAGNLLASYSPETEDRGTDWLALASDDCTLYYTSEGAAVKRFNVCTNKQLPDFVDNLPGGNAYQLRFLPDGGMLVADSQSILRLDKEGHITKEYTTPSGVEWFNVQFSPGASTFWAGDISTGNVAEFDLNSGNALAEFNSEPATELAGLTVIGSPDYALKDSDGDGIPDEWEEHGIRDAEGHMLLNLPAMGADPHHKDVFVQLDAMHGLALSPAALQMVEKAFNDAPVSNPDGTEGIHLHVDAGPSSVMNPVTGETWGAQSLANDDIPFKRTLGSEVGTAYNWSAFEGIKRLSLIPSREAAFHYAISVNRYNGASSGISRKIPGSDFIVALGTACNPEGTCPGTVKQQAGTFMHELGHNLGLHHGGQVDENYVPNYVSVMNYTFQFSGLSSSPDGVDYSRYESPQIQTLDEFNLNEPGGFGVEPPLRASGQKTKIWCAGIATWEVVPLHGPVDFNCDGNAFETGIGADLHDEAVQPSAFQKEGALTSYNDWSDLWYRGGSIGGNGLGALLPETTEDDEPSIATLEESSNQLVPPPTGSTGNATAITTTTATLHGEAAPNGEDTHAYFQYGTGTDYGTKSTPADIGSTKTAVATSADISGLVSSTTYHYQEIIETPTHLLYGADQIFTTHSSSVLPPSSTPSPTPTPAKEAPAGGVASFGSNAPLSCIVPRLHGSSIRNATKKLRAAHCSLGHTVIARAARHHRRTSLVIVSQTKRPRMRLPSGAKVSVTLGVPTPKPRRKKH
jgi:hypothetical protein